LKTQKTILVPTDFSERANNALDQAVHLAGKINAKIIIYHSYHRPLAEESHVFTLTDLEKKIDKNFKNLLESIPGLKKIPYEFQKELGVSVDNIVKMANNNGIDLLLMATKGAKGFDEIWGTKTAKIVKMIETPVVVIPDGTSLKDLKKVALACDYSLPTDADTIAFLADMAQQLQLNLDVVTLNREEKTMTTKELQNREALVKQLGTIETSFSFTQHPHIDKGIMDYCKDNQISALVILSKNYSYIEQLFHESLTDKMIFNSHIPLIVL
jgi:nucleotide-binding universal stress UspA family protein